MKLPERDCYTLEEVARRWQTEVNVLHNWIAMDLLVPSIFVDQEISTLYFKSTFDPETGHETMSPHKDTDDEYHSVRGLVSLWGTRTGPMEKRFSLFYTGHRNPGPIYRGYTAETIRDESRSQLYRVDDLNDLGPDGEIPKERLVITSDEVARFEAQHLNPTAEPGQAEEKPITTNERNTLLVLIAALCAKAGIDPQARGAASQLMTLASVETGVPLHPDTVRDKLNQIPDAVGARQR